MAQDHFHDLPVCGYQPHKPHAGDCPQEPMIACGSIVDPQHPEFGRALCRHKDPIPGPQPPPPPIPDQDAPEPLPDCTGVECFNMTFDTTADAIGDEFEVDTNDGTYPMPQPGESIFNILHFSAMWDALQEAAQKEKDRYRKPVFKRCRDEKCACVLSIPPVIIRFPIPIQVSATFSFPKGGTATIYGTLTIIGLKHVGSCFHGARPHKSASFIPKDVLYKIAGKEPTEETPQQRRQSN